MNSSMQKKCRKPQYRMEILASSGLASTDKQKLQMNIQNSKQWSNLTMTKKLTKDEDTGFLLGSVVVTAATPLK